MDGHARFPILDFHERFELVARLGEGAHGEVFEAIDRVRGTRVALKALRNSSPQSILRFKREFRTLIEIHHVNLVEFGELFEHAGRWFFSMELVEGVDFVRYVRADLPEVAADQSTLTARLNRALQQLGLGLQALHRAGKIHRDIKPSNIRIQADGRVVLLDFGLVAASRDDSGSSMDQVVGTVGYMAPEQANASAPSPAADCYAVGILIYEAITGALPFTGTVLDVLLAKQSQPVQIPEAVAALLPKTLVELCHDLCRIDPAQRPSADELIARTVDTGSARPPPVSALSRGDCSALAHACLGRDEELAQLDHAFARAHNGMLSKVRLHGASGLGKTALLRELRERLTSHGDNFVLSGSCHERERVAYKAFDAAIDELGRKLERLSHEQCARLAPKHVTALVSLFPVLGRLADCADGQKWGLPPDPITLRRHAYAALRDLLHRMSERAPVVLLLDDLHWADVESLELLGALIRPPDPPPLLLVVAMWPLDECEPALRDNLQRAFTTDDTLEIAVTELPSAAAVALARKLLQEQPERTALSAEHLAEAAGRHPLFIEVLARAMRRGLGKFCELDAALSFEMGQLSDKAHQLLQLIAVAGTSISERTLADAAGLTPDDLAQALAELRREKFARVHESAGEFFVTTRHARIGSALLAQMSEATELQAHHLALATALTRGTCRDPEALAVHWLAAGHAERAAACFVQAAAIAERSRAFAHAAQLYRSALDAPCSAPTRVRSQWLQALASTLAHAGRSVEAAEAFLEAALALDPRQARDLRRLAAEQFLRAGMTEHGLAIARPLLAEIGEQLPKSASGALAALAWQRARLSMRGTEFRERAVSDTLDSERYACDLMWSISVPLTSLDLVRGIDLHCRCLLRALRLGDPARLARSLALQALYMRSDGADRELRVRGVLATADTLARRSKDPYLQAFGRLCHSAFHLLNGEPTLALSAADSAAFTFENECQNVAWEIGVARVTALNALSYLGRFRELSERFEAATEEAEARGNVHDFTTLVTLNRCTIDLAGDRVDDCRAELHRLMKACPAEWHLQHAFALGAHVLLDLYAGGDAAHRRLTEAWPRLRHQLILTSDRFRIFFLFVRGVAALAALLADDRDVRARIQLIRDCATRLARERILDAKGGAHMLRGQLAAYDGDLAAAVAEDRAAAELWARVGMYGCKIANLRLGEILGGD
ncbi:MAG TPA: protein kinase, partial [Polyangiales bacterium]|nr:protein kinase [Polyangiales bacterium]